MSDEAKCRCGHAKRHHWNWAGLCGVFNCVCQRYVPDNPAKAPETEVSEKDDADGEPCSECGVPILGHVTTNHRWKSAESAQPVSAPSPEEPLICTLHDEYMQSKEPASFEQFLVGKLRVAREERDTATFVLDAMKGIDKAKLPCGHNARYGYTEDGGKNGICLLCEREARKQEAVERFNAGIEQAVSYIADYFVRNANPSRAKRIRELPIPREPYGPFKATPVSGSPERLEEKL